EPGRRLSEKLFALLWLSNQLSPILFQGCKPVAAADLQAALAALAKPQVLGALAENFRSLELDGSFAFSVLSRALHPTSEPLDDAELARRWAEHRAAVAALPGGVAERIDGCLGRYATNHLFTTPYMLQPSLLAYATDLVVRVAALRFQLLPRV